MLQPVSVAQKHLSDYASLVGRQLVEEIRERAERLKGKRILHVSATAFGGGVSEILYTLVPLMIDVGLDVEWHVIYGREEFFNATKIMHNALQGSPQDLTEDQWDTWCRYNEINARDLSEGWDACIVHDPQPAAVCSLVGEKAANWVWRCHIDLSTPNPFTVERLLPYLDPYPAAVFHTEQYVPNGMEDRAHIIPPAIDPLAPKNMAFSPDDAIYICGQFGIDVDRPLLCQVSPVRPLEGSARGDRRLPDRQGTGSRTCSWRWSVRWRPTIPRGGTSSMRRSPTPTAIPTSTSSTTSTTWARSRSMRSSPTATCASRSRHGRASG